MSEQFDLQRVTSPTDVTVEWTYDNSTEAIEQGRRNADSNPGEVWEVVKRVSFARYERVWVSDV